MEIPKLKYEVDEDHPDDEMRTEQWYWNAMDGELILFVSIDEDEVVVADQSGAVEIREREGMIFNPEYVWSDLIPVEFDGFTREDDR